MTRTWMGVSVLFFGFFFAVSAQAAQVNVKTVSFSSNKVQIAELPTTKFGAFARVSVDGLETSKKVGAPELPVKSFLLQGTPSEIEVAINVRKSVQLADTRPAPVQPQECRCEVAKKPFAFDQGQYLLEQKPYELSYIGAFRGTPITRLDVNLAQYDAESNTVTIHSEVEIAVNAVDYSFERAEYKDYLIIVPDALASGVEEFAAYKSARGFNVSVEKILAPASTLAAVKSLIKNHYGRGADFVIIVGDEVAVPMAKVSTSGSTQTPTDLPNYTMDGAGDNVPDMFGSRIVASSAAQVKAQLAKSMEYELNVQSSKLGSVIGVASNEGFNPSDKEYVTSINEQFKKGLGVNDLFLDQNDPKSNPTVFNDELNKGAFWMTYLGHGSGYSWGNFNVSYNGSDFAKADNANSVKPVIIDVACMNGVLREGFLGANAMKVNGSAHGVAAYFGGTVNISWHPPAVMARGIAIEHMAKRYNTLGEAILAGQLYLTANWTNTADVVDNFEWYHIQGDPGLNVKF